MGKIQVMDPDPQRRQRRIHSKDPLYDWLVGEIRRVFGFLMERYSFVEAHVEADSRGCWVTFVQNKTKVQVWAEMGGRPQVDIVENGKRRSLNMIIAKSFPERRLPPRREYEGFESEKRDFSDVLAKYASTLKDYLSAAKNPSVGPKGKNEPEDDG